jgi:hypothetical protein
MQRILNFIKNNRLQIFVGLGIVSIFVLSWLSTLVSTQPPAPTTDVSIPDTIDDENFPPGSEERALLEDRFNSLSIGEFTETEDGIYRGVNLLGLYSQLPFQGSGYRISRKGEQIVLEYSSDASLQIGFNFLKQYGITGDYPTLVTQEM